MILDVDWVNEYRKREVPWGFASGPNTLGEVVYRRTYRRDSETWVDTLVRVTEGTYQVLLDHCERYKLPVDLELLRRDAQEFFDGMFHLRWLPPGRGLWMMGTEFQRTRGAMALNNCAFISTERIDEEFDRPFRFLMDVSMLGTGCGFDTRGAGKLTWQPISTTGMRFQIPDSREGWVESVGLLLRWGWGVGPRPDFDYSLIRPAGAPIRGFGGVSEGPRALCQLHERLRELIHRRAGNAISSQDIVDVMNMIGACVVAGNVRRSAEIALGDAQDVGFLDLKDYQRNPERAEWGWTSNNSVLAKVGMSYGEIAKRIVRNGEPGLLWLENCQSYSRMIEPPDHRDSRVRGTNPCSEQSLESGEVCCLVETFPAVHKDLDSFRRSLKYAFLYAKVVTLLPTHWPETNAVVMRNRRIGCSVSGVVQLIQKLGFGSAMRWLQEGYKTVCHYDRVYSEWLGVRESIKRTSVKPSGTVSLLAGATPGVHYPVHRWYIRRIRYAASHPDLAAIREAGYVVEPDLASEGTMVVEFPVQGALGVPTQDEVSMVEKVRLAADLQRVWADNQVSCTVDFDPDTEGELVESVLMLYDRRLKSLSFLPRVKGGAYPQMPYEAISEDEYQRRVRNLKRIQWSQEQPSHAVTERFCDSDVCEVES